MKTEQLIVQYLYSNKKVTLQDMGVFSIATDIHIPEDSDKDIVLPVDTIKFVYDPKAPVDDGLVAYIMETTRKIKPLAYSDLESFIILNKQFLNIGKPLVFEGMGTLQKTQVGDYSFTQAATSHVINEEMPKLITEKIKEKVTFATPQKEKNTGNNKTALWVLLGVIVLGLALTAAYFMNNNKDAAVVNDTTSETVDTLPAKQTADTTTLIANKPTVTVAQNVNDSNSFYIVIKEFSDLATADKSLKKLTSYGNKLMLTTKDSITYKMRMAFMKPITDTLRVKDSLSKFFQEKAYVELP
ncbi:MAG: hypothetical protein LH615_01700 [Ferruginibacter sp.]|nr:hypothetical protein [Ferruginibacter sp.]